MNLRTKTTSLRLSDVSKIKIPKINWLLSVVFPVQQRWVLVPPLCLDRNAIRYFPRICHRYQNEGHIRRTQGSLYLVHQSRPSITSSYFVRGHRSQFRRRQHTMCTNRKRLWILGGHSPVLIDCRMVANWYIRCGIYHHCPQHHPRGVQGNWYWFPPFGPILFAIYCMVHLRTHSVWQCTP